MNGLFLLAAAATATALYACDYPDDKALRRQDVILANKSSELLYVVAQLDNWPTNLLNQPFKCEREIKLSRKYCRLFVCDAASQLPYASSSARDSKSKPGKTLYIIEKFSQITGKIELYKDKYVIEGSENS